MINVLLPMYHTRHRLCSGHYHNIVYVYVLRAAGTGYGDSQMQDDAYGYTPAPPTDPTSIDREFICDVLGRVAENQAFAVQLLCRVHAAKPDAAEDNLFARLFREKEYYDSEWANELLDNLRVDTDFEDGRTIILKTASVLRVNSGRRVQRDEIRENIGMRIAKDEVEKAQLDLIAAVMKRADEEHIPGLGYGREA